MLQECVSVPTAGGAQRDYSLGVDVRPDYMLNWIRRSITVAHLHVWG